jgi:membrane protein
LGRSLGGALRYFYSHDGFFLAAGLSFYVVVCLVPFLLLLVAGGGYLLSNEVVAREVLDRLTSVVPVYHRELEGLLGQVVARRGVSSLIGTVSLVLFASQLLAATRFVLNRMFGTTGRGFLHGVLLGVLVDVWMILVLTVLFLASVALTAAGAGMRGVLGPFRDIGPLAWLVEQAGIVLGFILSTALFTLLYRFVPLRRMAWPSVLRGSLAAAALWEIAKHLFRWYILGTGVYASLYGSLGAAIALVMWVYYSAIVFVLGAAFIRALDEVRPGADARPSFDPHGAGCL